MPSRLLLCGADVLLSALSVLCVPSLFGQQALQGWDVSSQTAAIVLDAVDESKGSVPAFTFRNASQRIVAAFAVSFGPDNRLFADFFDTEKGGLAPGEVHTARVGFAGPRSLEISAVLFDDGTGEGSKREINRIRYNQFGQLIETERLNRIFQRVAAVSVSDTDVASLEQQVGELPASIEDLSKTFGTADDLGFSAVEQAKRQPAYERGGLLTGVHGERSQALRYLAELRALSPASGDKSTMTRGVSVSRQRAWYQASSARRSALRTQIRQGASQ